MNIEIYKDLRGWSTSNFQGSDVDHYKWYMSSSRRNVFRGFHGSLYSGVEKEVVVLEGSIIDYAAERDSIENNWKVSTKSLVAGSVNSISLGPSEFHGFYVMSKTAVVLYRLPRDFDHTKEQTFNYQSLMYEFPFAKPIISKKDRDAANFPI